MPPAMPALIVVNVGGEYTHYAPAERCVVTIRVSKEGDSQAYVLESVSDISNELAELFRTLCPKATLLDEDEVQSTIEGEEVMLQTDIPVTHWSMSQLSTSSWIPYVPAGRDGEEIKPARRLYKASTTFNVKFRDFKRMGQVCLDIAVSCHTLLSLPPSFEWLYARQAKCG